MNFTNFSFNPQINAGITSAGYTTPTPIQEQSIPAILAGRDLLGLAQTGTGKTAAFVLPMLQRLMQGQRGKIRALIVSPTRELAEQTNVSIQELGRKTGIRSVTVYGGVSSQLQIRGIRAGAEIIVACPGRLLDLMDQRVVNLRYIDIIVLDEADQMFDMGFLPSIRRIMKATPDTRQTLLFSATMPKEIRSLANEFMNNPVTVEIGDSRPVETVSHAIYPVEQLNKTKMLLALLNRESRGQVLVFTRTKHRARKLADQLIKSGISATSLQGNLSQKQRDKAMDFFRTGRARVMVATDIAARGIDISKISHVINFDMPDTAEAYTHRIGRTGRMENLGMALSLVTSSDLPMIRTIERLIGDPLERRKLEGFEEDAGELARTPVVAPKKKPAQTNQRRFQSNNNRRSYAAGHSSR